MHEDLVTLVGGEEAEALLSVVPLDLAGGHRSHASFVVDVRLHAHERPRESAGVGPG